MKENNTGFSSKYRCGDDASFTESGTCVFLHCWKSWFGTTYKVAIKLVECKIRINAVNPGLVVTAIFSYAQNETLVYHPGRHGASLININS